MNTKFQKSVTRTTNKLAIVICIQGLLGLQQAYATTYYVSPSGINTNNGTSLSTPVQTINKALSMAKSAGDIIYVRGGTYNETVQVNQNNITLSAYQNEIPVIDGKTNLPGADWSAMVDLNGNNIILKGFEVKNSNYNCSYAGGVGINSYGNSNTLRNINAHDNCSNGIYVAGDYSIVEDSDVYHNSRVWVVWRGSKGWGAGLSSADGGHNSVNPGVSTGNIMRRNKVHENWGEGISCFNTTQCLIEDSISYNNRAANIYIQNATYTTAQRNLIYITIPHTLSGDVTSEGIVLADERTDKPLSSHNTVINNFSYNADMAAFDWTLVNSGLNNDIIANNTIVDAVLKINYVPTPPQPGWATITHSNTEVRNNIIFSDRKDGIKNIPSGVIFSNNNYSGSGTVYGTSASDVKGDPLLTRTSSTAPGALTGDYFKVQSGSPVLDFGTPLVVVTKDFFKTPRATFPDIGGYQFIASTSTNVDSIAPSAPSSLSATAISSTQVNLTWKASIDNVSVAGYKIYRNGTAIGTSITNSFTDTSVVAGTTYNYTVLSYDTSDNLSAASNTATVQIVALKISSYSAGNITGTSATIKWSTNIAAGGTIYYRVNGASNALRKDVGQATSQSVTLTGLQLNTQYKYDIWVWANGQMIATPSLSFTTARR
jgi:chitodextrinase